MTVASPALRTDQLHASSAQVLAANGSEDPGGWEDAHTEGAQLLPRAATAEKPLAEAASMSSGGDAEQWHTISGLLLYALCTLCSSGTSLLLGYNLVVNEAVAMYVDALT